MLGSASSSLAVAGINCMRPMAPLADLASGLNPDSAAIMLLTNAGLMRCLSAMARMISFMVNFGTGILGRSTWGLKILSVQGWKNNPATSQAQKQSTSVESFIQ